MARLDRFVSVPREKVVGSTNTGDLFGELVGEAFMPVAARAKMRALCGDISYSEKEDLFIFLQ